MNTDSGSGVSSGRILAVVTALLVVSVALNVALGYKVRAFSSAQQAQLAKVEARRLQPGTSAPPITAKRVDSDEIETISYAGTAQPTVLYVLSPTCGWCVKNERSIQELISKRSATYRFIAISLVDEGAAQYASRRGLEIPLYTGVSEGAKIAYTMGATPQTIVVSPQGAVIANWSGAYLGRQRRAIEEFFDIELPEIEVQKR